MNLLSFSAVSAIEEEKDLQSVNISFEYFKYSDDTKALKAKLFYREGRSFISVVGEEISFYASDDNGEVYLAPITTDENGEAYLLISQDYIMPEISPGTTIYKAIYNGSEKLAEVEEELIISDLILDFELTEIDSVKTIEVSVSTLDDEGTIIPVEDAEIYVYAKRLYSNLTIGEDWSNEDGYISVEFPDNLPGDSEGNVTIIVQIPESDEYGTVEKTDNINWGIPVSFETADQPRALWSDEAPLWMVIGMFVVLLGAWINFGLAVYYVSRIKKTKN